MSGGKAAETAYDAMRNMIITGQLAPNAQIIESEISELLGVSRTPLREALNRLENEMLIRRNDTQRTFVREWSATEIEEIFAFRVLIEGEAARRAARHISSSQLEELRQCNMELQRLISGGLPIDCKAYVLNNSRFHDIVNEAASSERLIRMRKNLVEDVIVYQTAREYSFDDFRRAAYDHEMLEIALRHRDQEWAHAAMTSHLRRAANTLSDHQINPTSD